MNDERNEIFNHPKNTVENPTTDRNREYLLNTTLIFDVSDYFDDDMIREYLQLDENTNITPPVINDFLNIIYPMRQKFSIEDIGKFEIDIKESVSVVEYDTGEKMKYYPE